MTSSKNSRIIIPALIIALFITFQAYGKPSNQNTHYAVRQQICLNGLWQFSPVNNETTQKDWGSIWVPGAWYQDAWWSSCPGIEKTGKSWGYDLKDINQAWYEKEILIPESWKNSDILLEINRVSTDAIVSIDNRVTGTINWPFGEVNITRFIRFGKKQLLSIKVLASASKEEVFELMGTANAQVKLKPANLSSKGIIGEVYIKSRPSNSYISDIFVQTSVRNKELSTTIEFSEIKKTETIAIKANLYNENGILEKTFTGNLNVEAGNNQSKTLCWKWENPQLWDLDQPHLYTLKLLAVSENFTDEYIQEFGFREFYAVGKDFYLNNKKINLRPISNTPGAGNYVLTDAAITGLRAAGYNFIEIWPQDISERGMLQYNDVFMSRADKKGVLLAAPLPPSTPYIMDTKWQFQWNKGENKKEWEQKMLAELRHIRNHPSVVMWGINPNFFGHSDDQNPLIIGQRGWIKEDIGWQTNETAAKETIEIIKKHDPTRLVFNHHGAYTGDVHTLNFYLCLTPLQERLDWLSHYASFGNMPFMAIEFGTPLENTMLRGRCPFGESIVTEPLFTEYAATYLGKKAYYSETEKYRNEIKNRFIGNQQYKWWQFNEASNTLPSFQHLQALFNKETWRAWRTWGISGGMVPWSDAHGWRKKATADEKVEMPPFRNEQGGTYYKSVSKGDLNYFNSNYWDILPSATTLMQNNGETLAWIAGAPEKFTEKSHNFTTNQAVCKQVVLINDARETKTYRYNAKVLLNNKIIAQTNNAGVISFSETIKDLFQFKTPLQLTYIKERGKILLEAYIGNQVHYDTLSFTVFNPDTIVKRELICFDPLQKTTKMLQKLGFKTTEWKGESCPLLIVGREALSGNYVAPSDLKKYIENGGNALIMTQQPEWFEDEGFRVAKKLSRYVFAVDSLHPVLKGLDDTELCNWNGSSTLTEAFPDYLNRKKKEGMYGLPYYGWHWGNQGALTSVALEKPHQSAWRPILQCEFDLAYSPLMELNIGKGTVVLNTLDLEDYTGKEPVAEKLAKQLIEYCVAKPASTNIEKVTYWGDAKGKNLLKNLGIQYNEKNSVSKTDQFIIVGNGVDANEKELMKVLNTGGKVFFLQQKADKKLFDVKFKLTANFNGSLLISDWKETNGLSVSDTHWRTTSPSTLIESGCEIGLDGLFGKKQIGKGIAYFCQLNPENFNADSLTYFRFTRWRQTRALCQILSNLGVRFEADKDFLSAKAPNSKLNIEGEWKAELIEKMPVTLSVVGGNEDKGLSLKATELIQTTANEESMQTVRVPLAMERYGNEWANANGEVVFRKTIEIPSEMCGNELELFLGVIDDFDKTYFNGTLVGKTDESFDEYWGHERMYKIPTTLVKSGKNVIAVRVFDRYGTGGMLGSEKPMTIKVLRKTTKSWYHPDYRSDFKLGDDPFRYFRW